MAVMDGRKSEVLILGGGIVGLACAYFLNRVGREVRVLDKGEIGSGASGGNCGLVTPSHAEPVCAPGMPMQAARWMLDKRSPFFVRPRLDPEFLIWGTRFARNCNDETMARVMQAKSKILTASRVLTGKLIEAEQLDCQFGEQGVLGVCLKDETLEHLNQFAAAAADLGVPSEVLDQDTLLEREPALRPEVIGGVMFSHDAIVRPDRLVSELARVLRDRGVVFDEDCEVKAINVEGGRVHSAFTNKGLFEAEHFVLAAGAWSGAIGRSLQLDLPVEPGKGYSLTSNLRPDPCPKHALLLEERRIAVTPWPNGYRVGGTMEFAGFDEKMNKDRTDALIEGAEEYLLEPMPPGAPTKWFGYRPMTPDDLPFIGKSPSHENLAIATGHNMLGVSMAVSTGRLVAEVITGRKPHIDITPYDPGRFARDPDHWLEKARRWRWARQ
jgi:D-amino-acid dehydrogenase